MCDEIKSLNNIKNILYKKDEKVLSLSSLVPLISKKLKTKEDLKTIYQLRYYVNSMNQCILNLGTKSMILNSTFDNLNSGLEIDANFENQIREIIVSVDEFVDSLSVMTRTYDFEEDHIQLKKSEFHMKSYRSNLIKKFHEYKLKKQINKEEEQTMYIFVNDIIDVIVKESFKIRLKKLHEVLNREYS